MILCDKLIQLNNKLQMNKDEIISRPPRIGNCVKHSHNTTTNGVITL